MTPGGPGDASPLPGPAGPARAAVPSRPRGRHPFEAALRRRVAEHFHRSGRHPRACRSTYVKTAILLPALGTAYGLLVFAAGAWWHSGPLAVLLGLLAAGVGFNIQHDGGHHAYAPHRRGNALAALALELLGGSSYVWRWKHTVFHHAHANVEGLDTDIDLGPLARLSPWQRRRGFHRWQHLYLWAFYALLVPKWQLVGDVRCVLTGRLGPHAVPRPRGRDLAIFLAGKAVFGGLAFGLPLLLHPAGTVLVHYLLAAMVAGFTLSVVFQVAHCVGEAAFSAPPDAAAPAESAWAVRQVEATVDFARGSRVVAWLVGGLNFQIEHHLFPGINHGHYRELANLVEATCREQGVRYASHPTLRAGIAAHFRWLRAMGRP
jgi:linoleoyl-CoA desaturase